MNKKVFILCALIICIAFQTVALAERESASYSIDITFGGERFTNIFNIEWETEEIDRPYSYGVTDGERYIAIRDGLEASSPVIKIIHGVYPYRIIGHHLLDANGTDEIVISVDGKTYRGCINVNFAVSSLEYRDAGGELKENELKPKGMFVFPKDSSYYPYYFPDKDAQWDGRYGARVDTYFEYVDMRDGWYKTANGMWYMDSEIHQLTDQEIFELYGVKNPILFRYGDTDPVIGQVQEKLDIPITNELDDKTETYLADYQRKQGLLCSGLLDQNTYELLMK